MRSHLQSIPRMHRGSRRNPFPTRCVVSSARVFLDRIVAHAETSFRLGTWFFLDRFMAHAETSFRLDTRSLLQSFPRSHRGSRRNASQIGYVVSPAEISSTASWLTHKRLSDWLRRPTCRVFLDRIGDHAHAETSLRLVTWYQLYFSRGTEFFVDRAVQHRSSNVIKFHGSTHRTK